MTICRFQLIAQKMACPKYDEILAKMYTDPPVELLEFNRQNADLFAYLTNHTGKVSQICVRFLTCGPGLH